MSGLSGDWRSGPRVGSRSERLASKVASSLGLGSIELIRSGESHVFCSAETVIRVSIATSNADRQIALARQLSGAGIPVAAPLGDAIRFDSAVITVWERIQPTNQPIDESIDEFIDYRQLGAAIAKLHALDINQFSQFEPLPMFDAASWLQIETNLAALEGTPALSVEVFSILRDGCDQVRGWGTIVDQNAVVICHGDVHPQNVLMRNGQVVIIDWDTVCVGPREWDHAALLNWSNRWGGESSTYQDFANGYGTDFTSYRPALLQAQVRLLAPTINLATRVLKNPGLINELERRMQYWRGITNPPNWTPQ